MDYDDCRLQVTHGQGDGFVVRLSGAEGEIASPAGSRMERSRVERLVEAYRGAVVTGSGRLARMESGEPLASVPGDGARPLAEIGCELFEFAFPPDVLALYHRSRGRASEASRGLRLRVHVDLRDPALAPLGTLPWETLRASGEDGFLALDAGLPVVRYLEMARGRRPFPRDSPWRVLVLVPEPYGLPRLDVTREQDDIRELFRQDERLELVFPRRCTLEEIQGVLRRQPVEAVHFMGHGTYDEATGDGGVILEARSGRPIPVTGPTLRQLVGNAPQAPALWVLNGCQTGWNGCAGGEQAFGGAAASLLQAGAAAVVAMQLPIEDRAAIDFSRHLYEALRDGSPIDRAVSEARFALRDGGEDDLSWSVPSLYMRVEDGRIFQPPGAADVGRTDPIRTPADDRQPGKTTVLDHVFEGFENTHVVMVGERGRADPDERGTVEDRVRLGPMRGGSLERVTRDHREGE